MTNLGFEWNQIQDSVTHENWDKVMAMDLILSTKTPKAGGYTTKVRHILSLDVNSHGPSSPTRSAMRREDQRACHFLSPLRVEDHHSPTQPRRENHHPQPSLPSTAFGVPPPTTAPAAAAAALEMSQREPSKQTPSMPGRLMV